MLQRVLNFIPKLFTLTGISMKREDLDDETAKQGKKEEKCHDCVVGTWLKGWSCCTRAKITLTLTYMLRSQCFEGNCNRP